MTIVVAACSAPLAPSSSPEASGAATSLPGASGQTPTPGQSASPGVAPGASSQALIGADLASGAIDLGTSLELRAWALMGDPRLPERYDGAGSSGEDQDLLDDIAANLDTLPADTQAELSRYLLRPTDPQSPFSAGLTTTATIRPIALAGSGTTVAEHSDDTRCPQDFHWFHRDWAPPGATSSDGFRVWACAINEQQTRTAFDTVIAIGSNLWPRMTGSAPDGMGRPVPDAYTAGDGTPRGDGDGKLDVYLVDAIAPCRQRGDNCEEIEGTDVAIAPKDWPLHCGVAGFPENGCSGYIVLGRDRVQDPEFAGVFAHELFHVLQHAHNGRIPTSWYHEASATWAGWHFQQESYEEKAYGRFEAFQADNRSLLWYEREALYQYQAWGWPLLQHVEGGESNVYQAWAEIEQAETLSQVDAAIDRQLPFDAWFREFAVANAQPAAFIPGASSGLDDIRWQTHPRLTDFPLDPHQVHGQLTAIPIGPSTYPVDIDPLMAQYDEFQVLDDNIRQIVIDRIGISGADFVDLDVLAQVGEGDTWKRFESTDGRVVLCRDKPDQNVSGALTVVLSNHAFGRKENGPDQNLAARGTYLISAAEETTECNSSFVLLHGQLVGDRDDALETTHATFDFYIKWNRPVDVHDTLDMVFESAEFSFQTTVHGVCGGSRDAGGRLELGSDAQRYSEGDGIDYQVGAVLSDQRLDYGRILISFSASYQVPNSDPLCQPPPHGGITTCPLIWSWAATDPETLPVDAGCDDGMGTSWTARLIQE